VKRFDLILILNCFGKWRFDCGFISYLGQMIWFDFKSYFRRFFNTLPVFYYALSWHACIFLWRYQRHHTPHHPSWHNFIKRPSMTHLMTNEHEWLHEWLHDWHEWHDLTWMAGFAMNGLIGMIWHDLTWMAWFDIHIHGM
jgi:hypothetical protein